MNSILHSYSYDTLRSRDGFGDRLEKYKESGRLTPGFTVFVDLLVQWLELAKRASKAMLRAKYNPQDPKAFYKAYYQSYLEIGVEQLESLPTSWDYINEQAQV